MIECKECNDFANLIFSRGEITEEEIPNLVLNRHVLKGCDKKINPFKNWLDFAIENQLEIAQEHTQVPEWNKGYLEALNDAKERYQAATLTNEGTKI